MKLSRTSQSFAERLFGPIERRLTGPDSDGLFIAAVTPPTILRLPTTFVKLTADQAARYMAWYVGSRPGSIQDLLPDLSPDDRERLLNGTTSFSDDDLAPHSTAADTTHGGRT